MAKLGYGMLRLPVKEEKTPASVELEKVCTLVDRYIAQGGNYFDTAYTYHGGQSEVVLREAVVKRYPREKLVITDKLPTWKVPSRAACEKYFQEQLERCGVTYFDYFFLHWLNRAHYEHAVKNDFFSFLREQKEKGTVRHLGFSYHDDAEVLERILCEQPEMEVVQIQLNYLDWENEGIQSHKCYDVAERHGKRVMVMEPVKGGTLSTLPAEADALLKGCHPDWSPSFWAIRFVTSQKNVDVVLSGMNAPEQIDENMRAAAEPLGETELQLLEQTARIIDNATAVPCTACRYCESGCPKNISIPAYFKLVNAAKRFPNDTWKLKPQYLELTQQYGAPESCIHCLQCERHCPQHIQITHWLEEAAKIFS